MYSLGQQVCTICTEIDKKVVSQGRKNVVVLAEKGAMDNSRVKTADVLYTAIS